jgi:aminopeptidase N
MKKLLVSIVLLCSSLIAFTQHQPDKEFIKTISLQEAKNHQNLFKLSDAKIGSDYDLYYHRMNWYVNPAVDSIRGSVTSYFKAVTTMNSMQFELNSPLVVESIKYHNVSISSYTHASNIITINFSAPINVNQKDSITIFYKGAPPQGAGFGSFIQDYHNGTPIIWTLSEPFGAPDWWPCKNSLSDKIDSIDIYVTTPSQFRVGSNGLLKSETILGSNKVFHWKHKYPIATYLIAIAVTNYQVYSDFASLNSGNLEILNYVFPEDLSYAQTNTPSLIPVMQLYDSLFYDYPYMNEKYGHAQFGWGGGMEHQTMTFLVNFGYDLMAHELAHQWVGDKVTCNSWHDIWINEGFATYLTGLTYDFLNTEASWKTWKQNTTYEVIQYPDGSVYCDDTTSVWRIFDGRLSYSKGGMVLNMLRLKIGDSAFFCSMKNFLTDSQLAYGFAGTPQFKAHAEASSSMFLSEFFNDWIYNQGYPIYTLHSTFYPDSSVNLVISQTQSHASVTYFEMPVPIRFSNGIKDTLIVFNNTTNNQSFTFTLNFKPNALNFDPNYDLIAVLDTSIITYNIDNEKYLPFGISPNPFNERITIENNNCFVKSIEIYDLMGRMNKAIEINDNFSKQEIDLSFLKKGTYIIKVITRDNNFMQKIVKL